MSQSPENTTPTKDISTLVNENIETLLNAQKAQKPILRLKHISHLDLDGYGATMLSEILMSFYPAGAMTLETRNILPNKLAQELTETFEHIDDYDMVVITDLAINQKVLDIIRANPHGDKVKVFDHHISDIDHLEPGMIVTESSPLHPGKLTCATELYYTFIRTDPVYNLIHRPEIRNTIAYFVECVRIYDTFEFWPSRNDDEISRAAFDAPRLNTLFHIMDRDEFKAYIMNFIMSGDTSDLTISKKNFPWISKVLELENNKNNKYVESAIRRLVKVPFKYTIYRENMIHKLDYIAGVIFAEKSSPVIANTALERVTDIDFCAVVSNNQVSVYTNKKDLDVSKIAKIFGGGGHQEAAGFTIPYINASVFNMEHFGKIIECAGHLAPGQCPFDDIDVTDTN